MVNKPAILVVILGMVYDIGFTTSMDIYHILVGEFHILAMKSLFLLGYPGFFTKSSTDPPFNLVPSFSKGESHQVFPSSTKFHSFCAPGLQVQLSPSNSMHILTRIVACVCMCMYVHMYIYNIYIYVYIYIIYIYICIYIYTYIYTYVCVLM